MIITPEELAIHEPDDNLLDIINNKTFNDKVLYKKKSDFHSIKVVENEIGRFLHYKDTYQAGYINTPYYMGNIPYINYFLIPYLMNPNIKDILLIGLGTGRILKQFETLFKKINRIDAVDIEENIVDIAQEYFGFVQPKNFNFVLQDGISYLNQTKRKYDLIIADIASDEGIDTRFCEKDYLKLIKKHLKHGGIFVSNMPSSADVLNPENEFVLELISMYKNEFANLYLYKGNTSDKVYYKAFFDIDERVIDITNLIFIATDFEYKIIEDIEPVEALGVNIRDYLQDLIL